MKTEQRSVVCKDIHEKEYTVSVAELQFRPSVYGVVLQDGKVLLSKQWDGYNFPGGGVELGEKITDALMREVKEETGFNVRVGKLITVADSFFKMPFTGEYVQSILLYYLCEVVSGEASMDLLDDTEKKFTDKPEWIEVRKLGQIKFYNSADSIKIITDAEAISK